MKILFLHGLESKPGGPKPTFLSDRGYDVIEPALPKESWTNSLKIAEEAFEQARPDIVVGSSRGGAVAIAANLPARKLILIAPAWMKYCPGCTAPPTTTILHSTQDSIIPFSDSELLSEDTGAELIEIGTNHRMNDPKTLEKLIQVINRT